MEANTRFAGPETMETKIFGRLTAWQNWVFQRPNAVGDNGALKLYGTGKKLISIKKGCKKYINYFDLTGEEVHI